MSKLKDLTKQFPDWSEVNGEIEFKSFRDTASQILKKNGRFNKRKLNEFIFVIENLKDENLGFEIMKEILYNHSNEDNFFNVYQRHVSQMNPYEQILFRENNNLKLVLAASYFNHISILKWLKDEQNMSINVKITIKIRAYI